MFSARPEFLLPHAAYAKPQPTELGGSDCQLLQICPLWTHELMARAVCEPGPRGRAASGLRKHGVSVTVAGARACPAAPARAPATGRDFVMRPVQFVYSAEAEAQEFMSGVFSPILRRDDKVRSFDFRKDTGAKWLGIITRVLARLTADLNSGKSWNPIVCGTHRWRRKPASPRGLPRGAASPLPTALRSSSGTLVPQLRPRRRGTGARCRVCAGSRLQRQNSNPALPGSWPGNCPLGHSGSQSPLGFPSSGR